MARGVQKPKIWEFSKRAAKYRAAPLAEVVFDSRRDADQYLALADRLGLQKRDASSSFG